MTWKAVESESGKRMAVRSRDFFQEPVLPEFALDVDWVDPAWPKVVQIEWDVAEPAMYYYVRLEQIDGAVAWSSPVWFR